MDEAGGACVDFAEIQECSESDQGSEHGDKSPTGKQAPTQRDEGGVACQGLLQGACFEGAWWRNEKMLQLSKPNDEPCAATENAS